VNGIAHILPDYLEPGGAVIVNLPVADGLIFRMARLAARFGVRGPLNRMWQAGLPSPHLSYFTGMTLRRLFEAAGFSCVRQGQLQSFTSNGLYDRIRYDRDIGPIKAAALYIIARAAGAVNRVFPSDIQYFVFRLNYNGLATITRATYGESMRKTAIALAVASMTTSSSVGCSPVIRSTAAAGFS
jgi:hypothetical protein